MARATGFVMPVVLGIILIAALLAAQATTDLGTHSMLATHRVMHLRAFAVAERGLDLALSQWQEGVAPPASQELPVLQADAGAAPPDEGATITVLARGEVLLPPGYSAGRVIESCHELRSVGRSARSARVTLGQGVCQRRAAP